MGGNVVGNCGNGNCAGCKRENNRGLRPRFNIFVS